MPVERKENPTTELLTPTENGTSTSETSLPLREQAVVQLKKKRDFRAHLLAYVLVNAFLWLIWSVVLTRSFSSFPSR